MQLEYRYPPKFGESYGPCHGRCGYFFPSKWSTWQPRRYSGLEYPFENLTCKQKPPHKASRPRTELESKYRKPDEFIGGVITFK